MQILENFGNLIAKREWRYNNYTGFKPRKSNEVSVFQLISEYSAWMQKFKGQILNLINDSESYAQSLLEAKRDRGRKYC